MKFYNCYSEREKNLKELNLNGLDDYELEKLADDIREDFREGILKDETIVVEALYLIANEALSRVAIQKTLTTKFINIGLDING